MSRANPKTERIITPVPDLRIVPADLFAKVQAITSTDNSAFGSAPLGGFALPFQIHRLQPAR